MEGDFRGKDDQREEDWSDDLCDDEEGNASCTKDEYGYNSTGVIVAVWIRAWGYEWGDLKWPWLSGFIKLHAGVSMYTRYY